MSRERELLAFLHLLQGFAEGKALSSLVLDVPHSQNPSRAVNGSIPFGRDAGDVHGALHLFMPLYWSRGFLYFKKRGGFEAGGVLYPA